MLIQNLHLTFEGIVGAIKVDFLAELLYCKALEFTNSSELTCNRKSKKNTTKYTYSAKKGQKKNEALILCNVHYL